MVRRKKILLIAGGGAFGIIPAGLLSTVAENNLDLSKTVDVFGGTSIGGILSMFYASDMKTTEVYSTFNSFMDDVFHCPWYRLFNLFGAKYPAENLEKHLKQYLNIEFGQLRAKAVIPSLDFQNNTVKIFDNISQNADRLRPCWMIGRSTSAAPTYFNPFDCERMAYIDGGLIENIPVMTTCTALHSKGGISFKDMDVFAIGTGFRKVNRDIKQIARWTKVSWLSPMIELLTEANEKSSNFWARELGLGYYDFFNPVQLGSDWKMDDTDKAREAEAIALDYIDDFKIRFENWLNA